MVFGRSLVVAPSPFQAQGKTIVGWSGKRSPAVYTAGKGSLVKALWCAGNISPAKENCINSCFCLCGKEVR